ncbi:MAG: NAD+ synthase, partial [Oculatellaceae cyanobacterium Prado106]|nr:NAD+ synthase [Oculatellaceae cyanobacterium Prado106]
MKIAIAQLNPTIGDLIGNAQQILNAAQSAAQQGANLMITPELALCGYPPRDLLMQPAFVDAMADRLAKLAQELPPGVTVLVGTVERNERSPQTGEKALFNSCALLAKGKIQQYFRKRLLPTYDVFDEDRYFASATSSNSFLLHHQDMSLRIGVTICEDIWNDEGFWGKRSYAADPIADLVEQDVDLTVNLSASPYSMGKQKLREAMLQHAAVRYQQPILYANQVGGNDDLVFDGNSVGFNRKGVIICRGKAFESDLILVEYDPTTEQFVPASPQPHESSIAPQPENRDAE